MEEPAALVADAMLGKLARWLCRSGYGTVYDAAISDHALAELPVSVLPPVLRSTSAAFRR